MIGWGSGNEWMLVEVEAPINDKVNGKDSKSQKGVKEDDKAGDGVNSKSQEDVKEKTRMVMARTAQGPERHEGRQRGW